MANLFSSSMVAIASVVELVPETIQGTSEIVKSSAKYVINNTAKFSRIAERAIDRWEESSEYNAEIYRKTVLFEDRVSALEELVKLLNNIPKDKRADAIKSMSELMLDNDQKIIVNYAYIWEQLNLTEKDKPEEKTK